MFKILVELRLCQALFRYYRLARKLYIKYEASVKPERGQPGLCSKKKTVTRGGGGGGCSSRHEQYSTL